MDRPMTRDELQTAEAAPEKTYVRFTLAQRIEHMVLLVSFTTLGITGLAQKFALHPLGAGVLALFGGIREAREVHRVAAVVLMAVSIFHIVAVLYRVLVLNSPLNALPTFRDFQHVFEDFLYYLGRRKHKAYYGRYSYAEKMEYLAVVWGTVIMAITGFMLWNPIATTEMLPGEFVPAAKEAHSQEALLAVLAIILWHFYHVHIRQFNKSMFTGKLTREEMLHEHPAELALIEAGKAGPHVAAEVVKTRQKVFFPIAAVLVAVLTYGLVVFVTLEETAITTVDRGETGQVFVPFTPTPSPTPLPTGTPAPPGSLRANSWEDGVAELLESRCGSCHVQGALGELSLATYAGALEGGVRGPAVVPNDPGNSTLVQVQQAGGHPGQLTQAELEAIINWINAGAPE